MSQQETTHVTPDYLRCWNPIWPWQYVTGKPFTVTCGQCRHTWRAKVAVAPYMSARCPECRAVNEWEAGIGR